MKNLGAGVTGGLLLVIAIIVIGAMLGYKGEGPEKNDPKFPPASPGGGSTVVYAP